MSIFQRAASVRLRRKPKRSKSEPNQQEDEEDYGRVWGRLALLEIRVDYGKTWSRLVLVELGCEGSGAWLSALRLC